MKEELIKFETARLAKHKRFNLWCDMWYTERWSAEPVHGCKGPNGMYEGGYTAPTQTLLQKWLREEHGLHIEILLDDNKPYNRFYYRTMKVGQYFTLSHDGVYDTDYAKVLEAGLVDALNRIKNE